MGTCSSQFYHLVENGGNDEQHIPILDTGGSMVCDIVVYQSREKDGSVCAQFELRFADKPSAYYPSDPIMDFEGYAARRSWVMVQMVPRQSEFDAMRFRVNIPGKASGTSDHARDAETSTTEVRQQGSAIQALRKRCGDIEPCDYPVCAMATHGSVWELADDGCVASLVALASQSLLSQGSDT